MSPLSPRPLGSPALVWLAAAPLALCLLMSPAYGVLRHEYLFNSGDGLQVLDTAGTAHGTVLGAGMVNVGDSRLALDGASGYAELPAADIAINTYSEVTLEMWLAPTPANTGFTVAAHLGRVGDAANEEDANLGYDYLMFQPIRGNDQGSYGAISNGTFDGEVGIANGSLDMNDGLVHHIVLTVDDTNVGYYVDGAQIGTAPLGDVLLSNVSNDLAYLGRSLYAADPYLAGSIYEFRIFDDALDAAAVEQRFTDGCTAGCGSTYLEIDRTTGAARIVNSASTKDVIAYSINSAAGALTPDSWDSIAETGDANSGGSIDGDDDWAIVTETAMELNEIEPVGGGGPDDGFPLTASVPLGGVWAKSRFEDLTASVTYWDGVAESQEALAVRFIGNGDQPFSRSDIDVDGDIDADDYGTLLGSHLTTLTGTTPFETSSEGDLDGDLDNDFDDFRLFKNDFIAANGAAAFAALGAVPEPSSMMLALVALAPMALRRRK